jgi:outer membrane usher protein
VPDLRSYDINNIGIDPNDVPLDTTVPFATRKVRPQDRSGVAVNFPLRTSRGALLRLVDETGKPIPLGSTATLRPSGAAAPVGYDGAAFIEGLEPEFEIAVGLPNGKRCLVAADYRPVPGEIPTIGPLPCREVRQ